ncbi:MAG: arsenite methyltransferase [Tepidisphaerales bacterium]
MTQQENPMGCCDKTKPKSRVSEQDVREKVRHGYAAIAQTGALGTATAPKGGGCCGPTCGGMTADALAGQIGYSAEEIKALPEGANMGLSCGNPTAIANLKPGQVVLDLGSGGGFDVFLAGPKVGAAGRVIGVDMTPEMLSKARRNTAGYRKTTGLDNIEFRLGEIEHLPVADASVDVVISNCVINLSPDKPQVWREIARVLRPGGRVAASDMALLRLLPADVAEMVEALVGCIAGAVLLDEYRQMVVAAGLVDVALRPKPDYVAALADSKDPLYQRIAKSLPKGMTAADFITSVDVTASKP